MIKIEVVEFTEDVYDLTVEDNHNFFADGILVHNCVEATLNPHQFCNLTELNVSDLESQEDFNERAKAAAFIGTLQAGYTDFHYLRPIWKETTEKEALLGVGMTGIASGEVLKYNMEEAAQCVVDENRRVAAIIGINPAARTTLTKPSGCLSEDTVLKTSKGNLSLKQIFELNGYEVSNLAPGFYPILDEMFVYDMNNTEKRITKLFINGVVDDTYLLEFDNTTVRCTPNHKFLTAEGWKRADELVEGDDIISY